MLIVIVSVFLLLEIPLTITTILHVLQNTFPILWVDYNTLNTTILITNFFIIVSYPINFAIYCGMSRQFRQTFTELFIYGMLGASKKGGGTILATSERTNAITGASSSTFGVTSKSCTFSVTVPETGTDAAAGASCCRLGGTPIHSRTNGSVMEKYHQNGDGDNSSNGRTRKRGSTEYNDDDTNQVLETEL